jgi:amidase
LCFGALGTDAGASIRIPASVTGVTSLRPTWGRVSRAGLFEMAGSFDQVGAIARSAADCAAIFSVISRPRHEDHDGRLRIGFDEQLTLTGVDGDTERVVRDALDALGSIGAAVVPIRFPDTAGAVDDWAGIAAVEAARAHRASYAADPDEYGAALAAFIERGRAVDGASLAALTRRRRQFSADVQRAFLDIDALIVPVLASTTPTMHEMSSVTESMVTGMHRFTCPWPMSGNPSITLPGGMSSANLPIGFQLVGPRFSDEKLLRIGADLQTVTDWHTRRPPLTRS